MSEPKMQHTLPEVHPPDVCKDCGTVKACPLCNEGICVLCGFPLHGTLGCDPKPLAFTGRCCHQCDVEKVMPTRGGLIGYQATVFARNYREYLP